MVGTAINPVRYAHPRPTLHIECCTKQPESSPPALADRVEGWLRKRYATVKLKQTFLRLDGLHNSEAINFITVADFTPGPDLEPYIDIHLVGVIISVDIFELHGDEEQIKPSEHTRLRISQDANNETSWLQTKTINLPNRNLHGVWDSLVFEDCVQFRLLRSIMRMVALSARHSPQHLPSWSRIVLLHGPPGTGKTSLCQALAQQLSIRLSKTFPLCKLVTLDCHSMFSQYFGESGKIVNKYFATIESMLDEDQNTLTCIFIDEIESLAGTRQCSSKSQEPQDSLRAVNALLIALDRLRHRPNVLVFCTSNLIDVVDPGFLDRADIKQYIPDPSPRARYDILRTCYLELAQCGVLAPVCQPSEAAPLEHTAQDMWLDGDEDELGSGWASLTQSSPQLPPRSIETLKSQATSHIIDDRDLPPHHLMLLHFSANEDSLPRTLWKIASKSTTLSGRTLRRLPVLSLAMFAKQDPCPLDEALAALSRAVDHEVLQKQKSGIEERKIADSL